VDCITRIGWFVLGIAGVVEFGNEKAPWRYAGGLYEDIIEGQGDWSVGLTFKLIIILI
jgi:hypothetical protein